MSSYLSEKEVLDIILYQPHLLTIKKFGPYDNDLIQEYAYYLKPGMYLKAKYIFKKCIENKMYNVNYQNKDGNTLMHILIMLNETELINYILELSIKYNKPIFLMKNKKQQTILHYICYNKNFGLLSQLIEYLEKTSQDTPNILNEYDNNNRTPICICIKNKNEKMLELLLKNGANPNYFVDEKYIPLHYAIQKRFKKGILLLIKFGAQKYTPSYIKKSLIEKTKSKFVINLLN